MIERRLDAQRTCTGIISYRNESDIEEYAVAYL